MRRRTGVERIVLCFFVYLLVISADGADIKNLNIWPMPKSVSYGNRTLYLSNDFELNTKGSKFVDASGILKDAFLRSIDVVRATHVIEANTSKIDASLVLKGIHIVVFSPSDELQHGIDESYQLHIPAQGNPLYAHLEVDNTKHKLFMELYMGCRHLANSAILTLNQEDYGPSGSMDHCRSAKIPRHYQPLPVIKKVIDSMTYAKLNVLHWHIVDSQSFPLEIPSYPKLWNGAYSMSERYTIADAVDIVSYAKKRGINVLAEIDVPGHAQSWGVGYPYLWPSADCKEPLDVSNEFTFKLIDGILSDFSKIFKYKFIHLGGDEVNTSCWQSTPHVRRWLRRHGMNGSEAYQYFVLRAQKIALSHGYEIINWLGGGVAQQVVKAGLRCIVSNQDKWYLDHLDALSQDFYTNEPLTNITDPRQQALVLGGEVCAWAEHIDASDIEQTIWPRAAAAAERLWTSYEKLAKDPEQVRGRLSFFRCLLNQRGVAAAPLDGLGRAAPEEPGSCFRAIVIYMVGGRSI
ncbi:UNVERIFIED_CONTAM: Beta-hexosaminidase 3 [Sesamum latifolium]|uniref:Beta-hexosaminidase n=1 Tax=Sesamum latifolium TaxID=2727402 RepID=A0AAW2TCQ4_9LAMI